MNEFYPEGRLIGTKENDSYLFSQATLTQAMVDRKILEARATICSSNHDLTIDLGCMKGFMCREECALGIREGTTKDIAIISRVNRPVCFIVTGFKTLKNGTQVALLSRRLAQEVCKREYLFLKHPGDIIDATVTHLENFGAFVDIGCGIASLIPIDLISVSRIDHPSERFSVGMHIKAIIKSIGEKINLTHKELLGTWEENANLFSTNETVAGIVRSVEDYGAFIELTPNLSGLAEYKGDLQPKKQVSVYIKSIIPEKMKIKLIIIDTFDSTYSCPLPKYFISSGHMDRFSYSPKECKKIIETIF